MEHIIYRTSSDKQKANAINLKQECINKICQHLWFSQLENKFDKIKDINISIWDKFHNEHRKIINEIIDQELFLPRILKWKIKNQCEILIHSLKYFYLVYLRVPNERYVNDIIRDQKINLNNLAWLKCGMVNRQRSLINLILPILNEFNTSNLFTIGYKFCLPPLLVQVFQVSDCKLGINLDTNDVHSFLYIYFICYCKLYTKKIRSINENLVNIMKTMSPSSIELAYIEEDAEFKTQLANHFKEMRFVDIDWLVLMNYGDDNILPNLISTYDIDQALTIYSFLTRNKMAFEFFWDRVDDKNKQGLCNYLIEFLRFIPTFHNVFYFLIMYDYLPPSFKYFIQNNDSMRKLHQLSMLNESQNDDTGNKNLDKSYISPELLQCC